jgi:galactokinase/mevalonate kinase-like predicted kinase
LRLIAENEARVFRALQCGDSRRLGQGLAEAWELNKRLDPGCSNERIEALMECVHPHVLGAKLAGAGGGGFLLMLCPDAKSATEVRVVLANHAPSPHARFYEFQVCPTGLALDIVPP